jgi:hypothetical protein
LSRTVQQWASFCSEEQQGVGAVEREGTLFWNGFLVVDGRKLFVRIVVGRWSGVVSSFFGRGPCVNMARKEYFLLLNLDSCFCRFSG